MEAGERREDSIGIAEKDRISTVSYTHLSGKGQNIVTAYLEQGKNIGFLNKLKNAIEMCIRDSWYTVWISCRRVQDWI